MEDAKNTDQPVRHQIPGDSARWLVSPSENKAMRANDGACIHSCKDEVPPPRTKAGSSCRQKGTQQFARFFPPPWPTVKYKIGPCQSDWISVVALTVQLPWLTSRAPSTELTIQLPWLTSRAPASPTRLTAAQ